MTSTETDLSAVDHPAVSVVVPVYDNETTLATLVEQIIEALGDRSWEIVLVDDGSNDASWKAISDLTGSDSRIRGLKLARNYGQTPACLTGFGAARGDVLVMIDADLENDPHDIPPLLDAIDEGHDFVSGWRTTRRGLKVSRRLPSSTINALM